MTSPHRSRPLPALFAVALLAAGPLVTGPLEAVATQPRPQLNVTCSFANSSWAWHTSDDPVSTYTCAAPQPLPSDPDD